MNNRPYRILHFYSVARFSGLLYFSHHLFLNGISPFRQKQPHAVQLHRIHAQENNHIEKGENDCVMVKGKNATNGKVCW